MKLNDVHGAHGQAGAVHQAADIAVQRHIVQVPGGGLGLPRVVLSGVVHLLQSRLTEQGVAVGVDLAVEAVKVAGGGYHQRVDLQQGQVKVLKQPRQPQKQVGELLHLRPLQAEAEGQIPPLEGLGAGEGVDGGFEYLVRGLRGHLLDIHPALGGGHEHDAAAGPVYHRPQIQLLGDVHTGLHQNPAHRLAFGIGLIGRQPLAEPLLGELPHLFKAFHQFDPAGLAPPAGVNLSLHHPTVAAYLFGRLHRLFRVGNGVAGGHRQAVFGEQLFGLIFVKIHLRSLGAVRFIGGV